MTNILKKALAFSSKINYWFLTSGKKIAFHLLWALQAFQSIRAKNSPIVAVPLGEAMLSHDGAERWVSI